MRIPIEIGMTGAYIVEQDQESQLAEPGEDAVQILVEWTRQL